MIRANVYEDLNEKQKVAVCDARFAKKKKEKLEEARKKEMKAANFHSESDSYMEVLDILFHSSRLLLAFPSFHFCFLFLEPTSEGERNLNMTF